MISAMTRVIGLISGTSVDGIDAALVDISGSGYDLNVHLISGATFPYPSDLQERILTVCGGAALSMAELAELDDAIAHCFAQAALSIQQGYPPAELIGSHGQTVFHRPRQQRAEGKRHRAQREQSGGEETSTSSPIPPCGKPLPRLHPSSFSLSPTSLAYSLQLGRGAVIAHLTRITTVSNFRAADIAAGGEGAPLVPAIDLALLSHPKLDRCVQNLGGIGNVAYLPAKEDRENRESKIDGASKPSPYPSRPNASSPSTPLGWDTGPGNVLLDLAVKKLSGGTKTYDENGAWAASGTPCGELVEQWLQQDFFRLPPPKSTGRELFGVEYLHQCFQDAKPYNLSSSDFLATLTELTAASIADSYQRFLPHLPDQVLLCGGGSKNLYLKQRLQAHLENSSVLTTDEVGLSADYKEAIAFAVLAYWRLGKFPGNLPEVTGASSVVLLGEIYQVS